MNKTSKKKPRPSVLENYFKKASTSSQPSHSPIEREEETPSHIPIEREEETPSHSPIEREEETPSHIPIEREEPPSAPFHTHIEREDDGRLDDLSLSNLPSDPGLRPRISSYNPNDQENVRRLYIQRGPCQPRNFNFPQKQMGNVARRFSSFWFTQYDWLEYSISKDAAFCLCCYLFKPFIGEQGGGDAFVTEGFSTWSKPSRFEVHVGKVDSAHNLAYRKSKNLMKKKAHISTALCKQTKQESDDYRARLNATVVCIRYLLNQGLAFRGHNEGEDSLNKGNFLELLHLATKLNEDMRRVSLNNAPKNNKLIAPKIQKDIVNASAVETINVILKDLGDSLFAVLIDESRDISVKEQMAVALRFVDKKGCVVERFVGTMHVLNTKAITLKSALDALLCKYGLNIMRLRGQGYDGASNMNGDYNGLKSLIMNENKSAYYVHCFAHQLQLTLVYVAKNHGGMYSLFSTVTCVVNIVGGSSKRQDILRMSQGAKLYEKLDSGEISSGPGLNQETSLKRAGDTRWSSHYSTLSHFILMFSSVIDVLQFIANDDQDDKGQAKSLMATMQTFDFVMSLHLMKSVLGITHELSQALQRKDQDIVNAMTLVKVAKVRLQVMRDTEWDALLARVTLFCEKHYIPIPCMEDVWVAAGRPRRNAEQFTTLHHFRVELAYTCIDMQLQELNLRFNEVNTELLICMACLNPSNSFSAYNKEKLIRLAHFYPDDFSELDVDGLGDQLETYIMDVTSDDDFSELNGVSSLAKKMVETKRNIVYPLVYSLIALSLILPVATATVERAFSAMHIVKSRLRNRMGDDWLNDCLIPYIERDIFIKIDNELIMARFQTMKARRGYFDTTKNNG